MNKLAQLAQNIRFTRLNSQFAGVPFARTPAKLPAVDEARRAPTQEEQRLSASLHSSRRQGLDYETGPRRGQQISEALRLAHKGTP